MKSAGRRFAHRLFAFCLGAFALPGIIGAAAAQDYPARPIKWVVSFPAGGPNDVVARIIGQFLSERLGQPVIIENKPGAGGSLGMASVLASPPDGYTIAFVAPNYAINTTLYAKLPYNFSKDSTPVAGTMRLTNVMVVHPAVPAKTVAEFIAHAKANPGKVNFASGGVGTTIHMAGELFKSMADINIVHVPYRGSAPALTDMLAGQVHVMFDNLPSSIEHIRRALRPFGNQPALRSLSNAETLDYSRAHPEIGLACHEVASNFGAAAAVVGNKGMVGFVAAMIIGRHGHEAFDEYMGLLGSGVDANGAELEAENPIAGLRVRLKRIDDGLDEVKPPQLLALLIKAFNLHLEGGTISKRNGFFLRDNERFPRFEDVAVEDMTSPDPIPVAAE